MEETIKIENLDEARHGFFDIDPSEVFEDARNRGLEVSTIEDFRHQAENYKIIENLMNDYTKSYARYSALGGATSGIGGISTSITLSGLEMANTAAQLYRLSQRFAILNGFDPQRPLHKEKVYKIYLNTLGFKAATQTALKYILFRTTGSNDSNRSITKRLFTTLISRLARQVGGDISSRNISKLIPVVGGAVGAYVSYSYASDTGNSMRDAFKEHYFLDWHDSSPPEEE